jgi:hypothetical protein
VLLPGSSITLSNAGAPHATLVAIVVLFSAVALLVGPSFLLLFSLQSDLEDKGDAGTRLTTGWQIETQPPGGSVDDHRGSPRTPGPDDWLTVAGLLAVSGIVHAIVRRRRDR